MNVLNDNTDYNSTTSIFLDSYYSGSENNLKDTKEKINVQYIIAIIILVFVFFFLFYKLLYENNNHVQDDIIFINTLHYE